MTKNYHLWKDNLGLSFRNRSEESNSQPKSETKKTIFLQLMLLAIVMVCSGNAFGQGVFTSAVTGDWNSAVSWTLSSGTDADGIPDADDDVIITHSITVPTGLTVACNNISVANTTQMVKMQGASSILEIYGTLIAAATPTIETIIDCSADATAKVVFKRTTNGALFGATWTGLGTAGRYEINLPTGITGTAATTVKAREITITSGTFDLGVNELRPDNTAVNTGILTIQNGAVLKCGRVSRSGTANTPFASFTINGDGKAIFSLSSAFPSVTTTRTFSLTSTIEYAGATYAMVDVSYAGNIICSGTGSKTWTLVASRTIGGNVTVSGTTALSMGGGNVVISGNVTIDEGATIGCSNNSGTFSAASSGTQSFILNGTARVTSNSTQAPNPTTGFNRQYAFDVYSIGANSIVSFRNPTASSSVSLNIDQPIGVSFSNVEFLDIQTAAFTATFLLKQNIVVTGSVAFPRLASGQPVVFDMNSLSLKVGKQILNSLGTIGSNVGNANTAGGTRTYTMNGTLELNGSSAQNTLGGTDLPSTFANLTINNAAGVTVGFDITVNNNLTITSGSLLTVVSGKDLTVDTSIVNDGTLTIENNANLIQTAVSNTNSGTGTAIVKRNSNPLFRLDYTLWSSPVFGSQTLADFSPLTTVGRFYTYNPATDLYNITAPTTPFETGTGYLIRIPNTDPTPNYDAGTATLAYQGAFTGTPNNGTVTLGSVTPLVSDKYYAVGNPYPSTISAAAFLGANATDGTLYFWRKTNGVANTASVSSTGTAYATWTTLGATSSSNVAPNNITPDGTIAVGQGFIVKTGASATTLTFTNAMRTANNSAQFFKTKQIAQKDRVWLNLTNTTGAFSQALVGYMDGATQGVDAGIDGKYINDSPIALTSNINNEEYTIQGRPAFDASDVVALNFKTDVAGDYTIAIDHVDGLFATGQDVYLVDSKTGTETNLKQGAYTFNAAVGTDNARFTLKYQKTLKVNTPAFNENSIVVYKNSGAIFINSADKAIQSVQVYDIQGRLIAEQNNVKSNTATIKNLKANNQVLIVKISDENNNVVAKKVLN